MYVILVHDDNTLSVPHKQRIVQRSKLVDDFWILTSPIYNGHDMTDCTVLLEYVKPVSNEYKTETLVLSEEKYEEYLKYILPVDTEFTKEAGSLKLQLSFIYIDIDADGNQIQRVRKTSPTLKVEIVPIEEWFNVIPDEALSALDQRILKQDAQMKMMADLVGTINDNKADNIKYDEVENSLQLLSGNKEIGDKVTIKDSGISEDGIPVVDFGSLSGDTTPPSVDEEDDDVVEF